jgi:hypothetical protein
MGLIIDPVLTFMPTAVAKAGGTVIATFERRSTGAPTAEKTTYSIAPGQPYIFANASEPENPKVVKAPPQAVTLNPDNRRQTLVLRRTKSPSRTAMVLIDADVTEVDANGNPVLDGAGQPLPPQRSSGFVVIQG